MGVKLWEIPFSIYKQLPKAYKGSNDNKIYKMYNNRLYELNQLGLWILTDIHSNKNLLNQNYTLYNL